VRSSLACGTWYLILILELEAVKSFEGRRQDSKLSVSVTSERQTVLKNIRPEADEARASYMWGEPIEMSVILSPTMRSPRCLAESFISPCLRPSSDLFINVNRDRHIICTAIGTFLTVWDDMGHRTGILGVKLIDPKEPDMKGPKDCNNKFERTQCGD
jgi:hypothetical protein